MTASKIIGGGLLAGIVFYTLSLVVWAALKFLPVVPLAVAIPLPGLGRGWQVQHLIVSLAVGILFAVGYSVYGKARPGGWLYGLTIFFSALFPVFLASFVTNPTVRTVIAYGTVVALIGALLGGKAVSLIAKR